MWPRQEEMNSIWSVFLHKAATQVTYFVGPLSSLSGVADCLVIGATHEDGGKRNHRH